MTDLKSALALSVFGILFAAVGNAGDISDRQKLEFKDYLTQVVAAESIADPVQRCLAYPDLPGITWTKEHIEAHCRYHHEPVIDLKQMQAMAGKGDFDGLEAAFSELLARHDAESNQSELIHRAFEYLQSADADNLTDSWLKHSPESAFALTARAEFLRGEAWRARGAKFASETPAENLRRMSAFAQQAIPLYRKAIKLNPRMMQAYVGLLNVAMSDSESKIKIDTIESGLAQDDRCTELFRTILTSLRPRWGGSHDLMWAFQEKYVLPSIASRPLNAQYMANAIGDMVDIAIRDGKTADVLIPWVIKGLELGANEDLMEEAVRLYRGIGRYDLQHQHIAQIIRFRGAPSIGYSNMGNVLLNYWFYDLGVRFLDKALEIDPSNAFAHYRLAIYYHYTQEWNKAIVHAKAVKDHDDYGQEAIQLLAESLYFNDEHQAALPFAIEITARFPNAPESWGTRLLCEMGLNRQSEAKKSLTQLKRLLKPGDTRYNSLIQATEHSLDMTN